MTKRLAMLAAVLMLVVGFGIGSPADADDNKLTIYSAKFICGDSNFSPEHTTTIVGAFPSLVPGDYRTAINIHNPNNRAVTVTKEVVLTEAGGTGVPTISLQTPQAPLGSPVTDNLGAFGAVGWDCVQLLAAITTGSPTPFNSFAKGFLIIRGDADTTKRAAPLNVVAVYTTRGKNASQPITQVVQEVKGRTIEDESNAIADTHHEDGR
jgi:hypothetical protein